MHHPEQTGFTLLELLVVIAIAGVLTGIAIPSLRASMQRAESREAATAFYGALTRARSEAIASNGTVSVCARDLTVPATPACVTAATSSTAWANGWIVHTGNAPTANPLLIHQPLPGGMTLGSVATPLMFDSAGRVANVTNFDLCRSTAVDEGRRISVSRSGRVSLEQRACP